MKKFFTILFTSLTITATANAADFFSTAASPNLFTFGAHIGLNTSNRTVKPQNSGSYSNQGWGTGFDLGATIDVNIIDCFSIQPGIFFESRSNSYNFVRAVPVQAAGETHCVQAGKFSSYALTIPVLANIHFNLTDDFRWNVAAGPYIAFNLSSKLDNKVNLNTDYNQFNPSANTEFTGKASGCDFGLKFGTGIELFRHYTFDVAYLAGITHAWKTGSTDLKGKSKAWMFTVGYNF